MPPEPPVGRIDTIRRFNRFYTRAIGVLGDRILDSPYSLAEARVIYELAEGSAATAAELARVLGLDPGYLSRLLRNLRSKGIVARSLSAADGRRRQLHLTAKGRRAFAILDKESQREMAALLARLPEPEQRRLVRAMHEIEAVMGATPRPAARAYLLRPWRAGDIGWVVSRHGALYAEEYGWDKSFEGFVAEIAAKFVRDFDEKRERCWIAEMDGEPAGAVFLAKHTARIAKLRMLIVEPQARGLGIGRRLVAECVAFARASGYREIRLWTNDILHVARRLYEEAGFRLIASERHHGFGKDLVGETWSLDL